MNRKKGNEKTVSDVCLRNMGVGSTEEINEWFRKSYAGGYRIDGVEQAVDYILQPGWDRIQIVGDYDADGCTATAQFKLVLEALGMPVYTRIPHRFTEGYGLSPAIIAEIPDGNNLVITVDNGITAHEAVRLAKERGFTVLVTDHHLPMTDRAGNAILPPADLVIDPNAVDGQASFNGYCGAGIAYRVLCALLDRIEDQVLGRELKQKIQPLAMIGTIADVMPLREENYVIARNGLTKLGKRIGTQGLLSLTDKLYISNPVAGDIGFKIGPCVNANGRLLDDGADISVNMLAADTYDAGSRLAQTSVENNNVRKQRVSSGMNTAAQVIEAGHMENDNPLVVYVPNVHEGIIGILAGRLAEKYGVSAIVLTNSTGSGVCHGSARGVGDADIKAFLDQLSDCMLAYGGHAGAAGMTIELSRVAEFRQKALAWAANVDLPRACVSVLEWDLEIKTDAVRAALDEQNRFEPFGEGNAKPVFKITNFIPEPNREGKMMTVIGGDGVKMMCGEVAALGFGLKDAFSSIIAKSFTLYGTLSYSYFRGIATPQIEIIDFEPEVAAINAPLREALAAV